MRIKNLSKTYKFKIGNFCNNHLIKFMIYKVTMNINLNICNLIYNIKAKSKSDQTFQQMNIIKAQNKKSIF